MNKLILEMEQGDSRYPSQKMRHTIQKFRGDYHELMLCIGMALIDQPEHVGSCTYEEIDDYFEWTIVTCGWSGTEDIIEALEENKHFMKACWYSTKRSGKEVYRVDKELHNLNRRNEMKTETLTFNKCCDDMSIYLDEKKEHMICIDCRFKVEYIPIAQTYFTNLIRIWNEATKERETFAKYSSLALNLIGTDHAKNLLHISDALCRELSDQEIDYENLSAYEKFRTLNYNAKRNILELLEAFTE